MTTVLGIENGTKYVLTRAGIRATFNDATDPDHVGFLDAENGATGLDGADMREVADEIVEGDGGIHGDDFWLGRRPHTFTGIIDANSGIAVVGERITRLRQIVNGARKKGSEALIQWQTTNGVPVFLSSRAQQPLRIAGRLPKQFTIAFVSASPLILSADLHSSSVAAAAGSVGGFTSPLTSPLTSGALPSGQVIVNNAGTEDTPPIYVITGPITNPVILNATTNEAMYLTYTLGAGEFLQIDTGELPSVMLNGTAARDSAFDFLRSYWPKLIPGNNDIRLFATAFSAPASLRVDWRDAWS